MKQEKQETCKHGMNPAWCAYCQGMKTAKMKTTGRGVGRIFEDTRPIKIWRKEP